MKEAFTEILRCDTCGKQFTCKHEFITRAYGQKLDCPHCKHCFFHKGICTDKHGYQCPDCEKKFPEFNP